MLCNNAFQMSITSATYRNGVLIPSYAQQSISIVNRIKFDAISLSHNTTKIIFRLRSVVLQKFEQLKWTGASDPEILQRRAGDNVSASSSFIENAHNELYAFYTGKGSLL